MTPNLMPPKTLNHPNTKRQKAHAHLAQPPYRYGAAWRRWRGSACSSGTTLNLMPHNIWSQPISNLFSGSPAQEEESPTNRSHDNGLRSLDESIKNNIKYLDIIWHSIYIIYIFLYHVYIMWRHLNTQHVRSDDLNASFTAGQGLLTQGSREISVGSVPNQQIQPHGIIVRKFSRMFFPSTVWLMHLKDMMWGSVWKGAPETFHCLRELLPMFLAGCIERIHLRRRNYFSLIAKPFENSTRAAQFSQKTTLWAGGQEHVDCVCMHLHSHSLGWNIYLCIYIQ